MLLKCYCPFNWICTDGIKGVVATYPGSHCILDCHTVSGKNKSHFLKNVTFIKSCLLSVHIFNIL